METSSVSSGTFKPICNFCLTDIESGTQGCLLSCGHFICRGCWRGDRSTSLCPYCGNRGRAAPLEDPPTEVRDFIQNPLAKLRTAGDVLMFQMDHFRSAARQACKALAELRLRFSEEIKRRENAEKGVSALRKQAAEWSGAGLAGGREESLPRAGSLQSNFAEGKDSVHGKPAWHEDRDGNSPAERNRPTFFGAGTAPEGVQRNFVSTPIAALEDAARRGRGSLADERGHTAAARPPQQQLASTGAINETDAGVRMTVSVARTTGNSDLGRSPEWSHPPRAQMKLNSRQTEGRSVSSAVRESPTSGIVAAGNTVQTPPAGRSHGHPTITSTSQLHQPTAQPNRPPRVEMKGGRISDARPVASKSNHTQCFSNSSSALGSSGNLTTNGLHIPAVISPQAILLQRPKTPGRPNRPAWQGGGGEVGEGGRPGPRPSTLLMGWSGPGRTKPAMATTNGRALMPLSRGDHRQQRPQGALPNGIRRPPRLGQVAAGEGKEGRREGDSITPGTRRRNVPGSARIASSPQTGFNHAVSTPPRSPLLATARGPLKRPSSGSLPTPKRPDSATRAPSVHVYRHNARSGIPSQLQGRAGTPVTPATASAGTPRLRTPQLPYMSRSAGTRPGSGRRPSSSADNTTANTRDQSLYTSNRQHGKHIPS